MFIKLRKKRSVSGFTLIEVMLAVALLGVLLVVVYGQFRSAAALWKRLNVQAPEEGLAIFQGKVARDLSQALAYGAYPFRGNAETFSSTGFIRAAASPGGDRAIGQVTYSYDKKMQAIVREEKDLSFLYLEKKGPCMNVLENVTAFRLEYFRYDKAEDRFSWQDSWSEEDGGRPVAVRFYFSRGGEDIVKTFPLGGAGWP